jgi:hypothetical protein
VPQPSAGSDRPGDDPVADAAEVVQQAAKAMIHAARDVLDAMERVVDDPKVADGLVRLVNEWAAGVATVAERIRRTAGPPTRHGGEEDGGVEHIEVG